MNSNYALQVTKHYKALCKHYANQNLLLIMQAISRVTSKQGLKILIIDGDGENTNTTSNVVFTKSFVMYLDG